MFFTDLPTLYLETSEKYAIIAYYCPMSLPTELVAQTEFIFWLDKNETTRPQISMRDSQNGKCGLTPSLYYGGSKFRNFEPFILWEYTMKLFPDLTAIELVGTYTFTFTIVQINYNYGAVVEKTQDFNVILKRKCEF